jgi:hypothetical protein
MFDGKPHLLLCLRLINRRAFLRETEAAVAQNR